MLAANPQRPQTAVPPTPRHAPQAAERRPSYRARLHQMRTLLSERRHLTLPAGSAAAAAAAAASAAAAAAAAAADTRPGSDAAAAAGPSPSAEAAAAEAAGGGGGLPLAALVGIAPPRPLGSALLMRRPWALLLRLVLQLGLSQVGAGQLLGSGDL